MYTLVTTEEKNAQSSHVTNHKPSVTSKATLASVSGAAGTASTWRVVEVSLHVGTRWK